MVPIAHVFALEDTPATLERLQADNAQGKIVLQAQRIGLGFPSPWLAATEKQIFTKKNECDFNCRS